MKRPHAVYRALVLLGSLSPLLAAAAVNAPASGFLDFGRGVAFGAEDDRLAVISREFITPADPANPAGPSIRFFGHARADLVDGVLRGEQQIRRPNPAGDSAEVRARLLPLLTFEPTASVPAGTVIQVHVDMVVSGQFEIPNFLFGPSGQASNGFDATLRMRNVSNNSGTLVDARYNYQWSKQNASSGVTETFSHTPNSFAVSPAFHSSVVVPDPLANEYRHGFDSIEMHIDFPYSLGSGALIGLDASIVSSSFAFDGGASGNWLNAAVLDLTLPAGVIVADENGIPLALAWDGVAAPIPEASTGLLFATGLLVLGIGANRRRSAALRRTGTPNSLHA
jgi:hypothetical protein